MLISAAENLKLNDIIPDYSFYLLIGLMILIYGFFQIYFLKKVLHMRKNKRQINMKHTNYYLKFFWGYVTQIENDTFILDLNSDKYLKLNLLPAVILRIIAI